MDSTEYLNETTPSTLLVYEHSKNYEYKLHLLITPTVKTAPERNIKWQKTKIFHSWLLRETLKDFWIRNQHAS